jgi:hypothetical protein
MDEGIFDFFSVLTGVSRSRKETTKKFDGWKALKENLWWKIWIFLSNILQIFYIEKKLIDKIFLNIFMKKKVYFEFWILNFTHSW